MYRRIGKFISYVLRHNPASIGIALDESGWADTQELIKRINETGRKIDLILLENVVSWDEKQRYSFNEDKSKIRANYGHSLDVDLKIDSIKPPQILYHGTAKKFLESIRSYGIVKRSRQYVHMSADIETALKVGSRHGEPVVLTVDAEQMNKDGYKFYKSKNGIWLTEKVPYMYVSEMKR